MLDRAAAGRARSNDRRRPTSRCGAPASSPRPIRCRCWSPRSRRAPAAGRRRVHRRHDPLDGQRARRRHATSAPRIRAAAEAAGRPAPRIVAGLPVAVHDDVDEARQAAAEQFADLRHAAQLPADPRPRRRRRPGRCRDRRRREGGHRPFAGASSTPGPPTCGRHRSSSATTATAPRRRTRELLASLVAG